MCTCGAYLSTQIGSSIVDGLSELYSFDVENDEHNSLILNLNKREFKSDKKFRYKCYVSLYNRFN